MKIGLLGDTHGEKPWIRFALWKFAKEGITEIYQVGDFGIYLSIHSQEFIAETNRIAKAHGQTVYITPGNHEDWDYLAELFADASKTNEEGWSLLRSNVLVAPRNLRWERDGVSFLSLGGAPSIDRSWRVSMDARHPNAKNKLWHAGEALTLDDVQKAVEGGYADVMLAHDAPAGVPTIDRTINLPSSRARWKRADLLYAEDGRRLITQAFQGVNPLTYIHGHYHFLVDDMIRRHSDSDVERENWTHVLGLDCNGSARSMGVYDTETKVATSLSTRKDEWQWREEGGNLRG